MSKMHNQDHPASERAENDAATLNEQAMWSSTTPERLRQHPDKVRHTTGSASDRSNSTQQGPLQDGYSLNEGDNYAQPSEEEQDQVHYDPAHSGARRAPNKPGMHTNGPGREGVTGWSEQLQNGKTTDTPSERKSPAN
jgi:hypothetical protein